MIGVLHSLYFALCGLPFLRGSYSRFQQVHNWIDLEFLFALECTLFVGLDPIQRADGHILRFCAFGARISIFNFISGFRHVFFEEHYICVPELLLPC